MKALMYSSMGDGDGGGEKVFERVAQGLENRGHEVVRVFADHELPPGTYEKRGSQWFIGLSIPPSWKFLFRIGYVIGFIKSLLGLFLLLWRVRPDAVNHHYFTGEALHFSLLRKIFRYRFVISCHGSDVMDLEYMHERLAPFILSQADDVTFVSRALAEKLREKISVEMPFRIICNGIDQSFWQDAETDADLTEDKHVVTVGAIRDAKGHDVLVEAFERVVEQHPGATLKIVGDGPNRSSYESLIYEVGLDDRITIAGWCSRREVRRALQQASVFVFPSRHEGFGLALVEAMAAGCPVVASKVGGIPEVVSGTPAMLVPPDDPAALAEAIEEALANSEWQERAAASSVRRASQFSWETAIEEYEECLCSG